MCFGHSFDVPTTFGSLKVNARFLAGEDEWEKLSATTAKRVHVPAEVDFDPEKEVIAGRENTIGTMDVYDLNQK